MSEIGGIFALVYLFALLIGGFFGLPIWTPFPATFLGCAIYVMIRPGIFGHAERHGKLGTGLMVYLTQLFLAALVFFIGRGIGLLF
jgi:hypothetical protein